MKSSTTSSTKIGIICAIAASFAFTLNDVGIKFLSGNYPLHQVVFFRANFALCITLAVIIPLEGGYHLLTTKRIGLHLIRGSFVVLANITFFLGLAEISLAEATAIFFVAPLIITIFSVLFLSEKVGPWRWFAVGMGLFGVIVIMRPTSSSFQAAALLPLTSAFCYASLHILSRKMGTTEKASTMSFYIQVSFLATSALMGLFAGDGRFVVEDNPTLEFLLRQWIWPPTSELIIMSGIGLASALGGYFISQAYRTSEAALIAPVEYIALVLAIIFGIIFFAEWPDSIAWIGIVLILSGGLLMLWRESVTQKKIATTYQLPSQK